MQLSDAVLPIVPFERFFRLARLINATKIWIMFCGWLGCLKEKTMERIWGSTDPKRCAKLHVLRVMQRQCFSHEIEFLQSPLNKRVPELVGSMNLFFTMKDLFEVMVGWGKWHILQMMLLIPF